MKMKTLFVTSLLLAVSIFASAQEVVSTAGETNKTADIEIGWTIGEVVIETISTSSSTLTQGIHQTRIRITAISEVDWPGLKIIVFPNPVNDKLNIEFNTLSEEMFFVVIDMMGKTIQLDFIKNDKTILDFSDVAAGLYYLKIQTKEGKPVQTFKIVRSVD